MEQHSVALRQEPRGPACAQSIDDTRSYIAVYRDTFWHFTSFPRSQLARHANQCGTSVSYDEHYCYKVGIL